MRCRRTTSWRNFISGAVDLPQPAPKEKTMKRYLWMLLTMITGLLVAAPAFAQGPGGAAGPVDTKWIWITSGFSMAIASAGCGYAQSKATAAACERLGR